MRKDHTDYYVYELRYPNGRVFYVGKGRLYRISDHEREARAGRVSYRHNVIRKIWAAGGRVVRTKVVEGLTCEQAANEERTLIAKWGRRARGGVLVNLTAGGEGAEGYRHDLLTRAKMSEIRNKRGPTKPETKERMRQAMIGRTVGEETRAKISASVAGQRHWNYGKTISEDHRQKLLSSRRKPVVVDGERYESVQSASSALGVSAGTVFYRLKCGKPGYRYT